MNRRRIVFGTVIVGIGVLYLLSVSGVIDEDASYVLPLVVLGCGAVLMAFPRRTQVSEPGPQTHATEISEAERRGREVGAALRAWDRAAIEASTPPDFLADGIDGRLIVSPASISVTRWGAFRGEKGPSEVLDIPIENVSAVELSSTEGRLSRAGSITIHYKGRSKAGLDGLRGVSIGGVALGWHNLENVVVFDMYQQPFFERARDLI